MVKNTLVANTQVLKTSRSYKSGLNLLNTESISFVDLRKQEESENREKRRKSAQQKRARKQKRERQAELEKQIAKIAKMFTTLVGI